MINDCLHRNSLDLLLITVLRDKQEFSKCARSDQLGAADTVDSVVEGHETLFAFLKHETHDTQ